MYKLILPIFILCIIALPYCTTTKQAAGDKSAKASYSYTTDVAPIILDRCTPCHFPETGKKKLLDTHESVSSTIAEILYRV